MPRWAWTVGLARAMPGLVVAELALPLSWAMGDARDRAAAELLQYIVDGLHDPNEAHGGMGTIAAGETLAFGWTTLSFRASTEDDGIGPGFLVIRELADPFGPREDGWLDGADQALELLHVQMAAKKRNFVIGAIDFPHRQDRARACDRVPPAGFLWNYPVFAERQVLDEEGNSGWFFACYEQGHDHANPSESQDVALHELVAAFPRLFPYLALPKETAIVFEQHQVVIFRPHDDEGYVDPAGSSALR